MAHLCLTLECFAVLTLGQLKFYVRIEKNVKWWAHQPLGGFNVSLNSLQCFL